MVVDSCVEVFPLSGWLSEVPTLNGPTPRDLEGIVSVLRRRRKDIVRDGY